MLRSVTIVDMLRAIRFRGTRVPALLIATMVALLALLAGPVLP